MVHKHEGSATPTPGRPPSMLRQSIDGRAALVADGFNDGRVNININQRTRKFSDLLGHTLRAQVAADAVASPASPSIPYIPPTLGGEPGQTPPPRLNVVVQIVGSRGDVQPFVALGKVLKETYGHRVRIATHPTFQKFVEENGLEFFSVGETRPSSWPSWKDLEMNYDDTATLPGDPTDKPFIADAIIANPPSFAHIHVAEKLGIPLHMMFTMPWSPTRAFPHPLANILSSNTDDVMTNYVSYALVEMMTWQGLGDVINRFRNTVLDLEPLSLIWAPGLLTRLQIPYTYCWSPALIPKPNDWQRNVDIAGFFFLDLANSYTPEPSLVQFLEAGPPPVYIGFGSIVVDDPNALTKLIFEAISIAGIRALVSKGWGGLGADEVGVPEGVYMIGNCPHDWLFQKVSCVVHHGGAGTSAAGIYAGKPTVVVPFFGDQPFWGAMIARAGAGPDPVPYKEISAQKLADAIGLALKPEAATRAKELGRKIREEKGADIGGKSFHDRLDLKSLRCSLIPSHAAVWRVRRTEVLLSPLAAETLVRENTIRYSDLKLWRSHEYNTEGQPWDPVSAVTSCLVMDLSEMALAVADFPVAFSKDLRGAGTSVRRIVTTGVKSPMNFCLGLAKGFRNVPKLYNDETVRPTEKVTGLASGVKVAGKEFGLGLYDGISGLVTQPLKGAEKEGGIGFVKGFGKGVSGALMKPAAAIWAIPAYTMQGAYMEMKNRFAKSMHNYIISSRMIQGANDFEAASDEDKALIFRAWHSSKYDLKGLYQLKLKEAKESMDSVASEASSSRTAPSAHHHHSHVDLAALLAPRFGKDSIGHFDVNGKRLLKGKQAWKRSYIEADVDQKPHDDEEFERAIQTSVRETSQGNAEEDRLIERAIRASVSEFQRRGSQLPNPREMMDVKRPEGPSSAGTESTEDVDLEITDEEYQALIEKAIQQSLILHASGLTGPRPGHGDSASEDGDEELKEALERSKSDASAQAESVDREAEEMKKAIEESKANAHFGSQRPRSHRQEESKATHEAEATRAATAKTEEEIVLEFVRKQSLAEEEFRKQMAREKGKMRDTGPEHEDQGQGNDHEDDEDEDEDLKRALEMSLGLHEDEEGRSKGGPSTLG
ncbi:unnamed protein product [Parascedosporium putredinis]|uniref:Glycosyltransferase family 28 N-terminal domain-containing protein n=1 Tax=Parascedosporium putredinis TaxID=1442378 RepID=A0A9P1MFE2_9PEZI|nr:unnamed protein product [Parascedosporium putredinis]CAI8003284.1 unnamed protein product [Parascedosporium putredinis]